jgi:hypothetical protein
MNKKPAKPKACKCIELVNQKLAGLGEELNLAFDLKGKVFPIIQTKSTSRVRGKRTTLTASFCPFCGKKYPS